MKTKIYTLLLLLSFGAFISCGGKTTDTDEKQDETTEQQTEKDSTANSVVNNQETSNNDEPKSIRLSEDLTLEERFLEVIENDGAVVWVANDEYQSVFEFSKDKRFKGSFKKGPNKFEGDWKIEGQLFSMKIDGEDAWNPIPLTVVDRETIVMMNLEFKAEN